MNKSTQFSILILLALLGLTFTSCEETIVETLTVTEEVEVPVVTNVMAPSAFTATATDANTIDLTWTDNASDETGYTIERAVVEAGTDLTFSTVTTTAADATSFTDTGLDMLTTYVYRLQAQGENSTVSDVVDASVSTPISTDAVGVWRPTSVQDGTGVEFLNAFLLYQFTVNGDGTYSLRDNFGDIVGGTWNAVVGGTVELSDHNDLSGFSMSDANTAQFVQEVATSKGEGGGTTPLTFSVTKN